jgi:hypothetical protein
MKSLILILILFSNVKSQTDIPPSCTKSQIRERKMGNLWRFDSQHGELSYLPYVVPNEQIEVYYRLHPR